MRSNFPSETNEPIMTIDPDLLRTWGSRSRIYRKSEFIYLEDQDPRWFFQIISGKVRMFNSNDEGREFTQGTFSDGESFGEPALLLRKPYPATAQACIDSIIQMLPIDVFFQVLYEYPEVKSNFLNAMAQRVYEKTLGIRSIINCRPETRILNFLELHKSKQGLRGPKTYIPLTRQEIANSTGLRVETVIRTLARLDKDKVVEIRDHKIFF